LVPVIDSAFRQIDELGSDRVGQCYRQIVGIYSIVTSCSLDDRVVNLDDFFSVAGAVILVDRSRLELVRSRDLPKC
jgi:hypothetical protein